MALVHFFFILFFIENIIPPLPASEPRRRAKLVLGKRVSLCSRAKTNGSMLRPPVDVGKLCPAGPTSTGRVCFVRYLNE